MKPIATERIEWPELDGSVVEDPRNPSDRRGSDDGGADGLLVGVSDGF